MANKGQPPNYTGLLVFIAGFLVGYYILGPLAFAIWEHLQ